MQNINPGKEVQSADALANTAADIQARSTEGIRNQATPKNSNPNSSPLAQAAPKAANQTTTVDPTAVAESLKGKGIPTRKIATLAEAIVARVNNQELTRSQREVLRTELGRTPVQKVISDLLQKKSNGVDSAQNRVYDGNTPSDRPTNEAANIQDQQPSLLSEANDYAAVTENFDSPKAQNTISTENDGSTEGTDSIITDGSHLENGKLKPNVTYKTGEHDYFYTTNEDGLIVNARTDDLQFKTHEDRLKHNPNTYGKKAGDHAGHLFGDQFGGSPELDNLVSQAKNVNLSEYKLIENQWAQALANGQKVSVNIDVHYDEGGVRPSSFDVTYVIDGVRYNKTINNQ